MLRAYRNGGRVSINDTDQILSDNLPHYTRAVSPLPLSDLNWRGQIMLRPAALLHQLTFTPEPRFIKTHHANVTMPGLPPLIPVDLTARAVYLIRHPFEVVSSFADFLGNSVQDQVDNLDRDDYGILNDNMLPHSLGSWSTHVESWAQAQFPVLLIPFDELKADAADVLHRVLDFCGLPVDRQLVRRSATACKLEKLKAQERAEGFRENQRAKTNQFFGGERPQLTNRQKAQIEERHGEVIARYLT